MVICHNSPEDYGCFFSLSVVSLEVLCPGTTLHLPCTCSSDPRPEGKWSSLFAWALILLGFIHQAFGGRVLFRRGSWEDTFLPSHGPSARADMSPTVEGSVCQWLLAPPLRPTLGQESPGCHMAHSSCQQVSHEALLRQGGWGRVCAHRQCCHHHCRLQWAQDVFSL